MKKYLYYIYWLLRTWPMRWKFPKYEILSFEDTIKDIINNKKSISRFGDGEFRLVIQERDIVFQKLSPGLSERLAEVISSDLPNLLIGIPSTLNTRQNLKKNSLVHWLSFINNYGDSISGFLNRNKVYGDSLISRFYMIYNNKKHVAATISALKTIWNGKDILVIEGELSRLGIGNDLFANAENIQRIICPSENAFEKYDEILDAARNFGKNKLIIIALGPTATVLSYDLAKDNYWALDLGHIDVEYMWYMQNAEDKILLPGKKAAEISGGPIAELMGFEKKVYEDSIVEYCL